MRIGLVVIAALGAATQLFAQERLRVVTTTADLKALVEVVAGDDAAVESLLAPEQDPHSFELKPSQVVRLRQADLIIKVGLDHEPWLTRLPPVRVPVVDASKSVRLLQVETPRLRAERRAHVHAYGNTHYWLDPYNAEPITSAISDALVALRPANAARFAANREGFLARLRTRIENWEAELRPHSGTRVVVIHDSWTYFAERFGLRIVAAAEPQPGVPPSPSELAELFRRMREANVSIILAEVSSNPALVRQIAEHTGARPVILLASAPDYIELFDENVRRLSAALKAR